jgi:hypothetical protein
MSRSETIATPGDSCQIPRGFMCIATMHDDSPSGPAARIPDGKPGIHCEFLRDTLICSGEQRKNSPLTVYRV